MATVNLTISLSDGALSDIRDAARTAGMSVSAWVVRAAQRQMLADDHAAWLAWRAANPEEAERADIEARLDELDREAARMAADLGDLGQAA